MSTLKKIFIGSVMVMTVMSMSVVVAPQAKAAASAGDLIKISGLSSVYYLGANGKRYVFPNEATYFSWYKDFSGVVTIPQSEMEGYPLAANVVIRPGTKLVKSPSINTVYAVEPNGVLRSIVSEQNAINLWGANWAKKVVDVIDSFFVNYTVGSPLAVGQYPVGQLVKTSGSPDVMLLAADGTARKFATEAAFNANNYNFDYVATAPSTYVLPSSGATVAGVESALTNVAQSGTVPGPVAGGSGLTVALASDTPASTTVPKGAPADFLKFNLTASNDGAVTVNSIKLTADGLGVATNIDGVTVYVDGVRTANAKDIDSNKEANFNFSNGLVIPAGQTKSVLIRATINDTNNHNLFVAKASDISAAGATVAGSFPISGNTMSAADVAVGTLTASAGTNPANPKLGDVGALLASMKLSNGNVEDIAVSSITLKLSDGTATADEDFENVGMYVSGVKVASSAGFAKGSKFVTFNFDTPYLIQKNKDKKFDVKGDVISGAGRTFAISLDSTSDIIAMGKSYNTNSIVAGSYAGGSDGAGTVLEITTGAVSLEKVEAPSSKVRADTTNVVLGTLKVTANSGKNVTLSSMKLTITKSAGDDDGANANTTAFEGIENVRIQDQATGNSEDMSFLSGSGTTAKKYQNTSLDITLTSGVTKSFDVIADVTSVASSSAAYAVSLASAITSGAAADLTIKDEDSNETVTDITPNTISFNSVTVQAPSLTFSVNPLTAALNSVVGSTNVPVLNFNMEANSTDAIKVTEIIIEKVLATTQASSSLISQYRLYQDDGSASGILVKTVTGSSIDVTNQRVTFSDLSINVPKSESVKYFVTVDFVKDNNKAGRQTKWGLYGYTAEDATKGDAVFDTTNDTSSAGVFDSTIDSARTITLVGSGSLIVAINNTLTETLKNIYTVAGTNSPILAAIDLRAANEDVDVTDITVEQFNAVKARNTTNAPLMWKSLTLLDSDKVTPLKTVANITASTTFSDLPLVVGQQTKTIYLTGVSNNIGKDQIGALNASTTFDFADVSATGHGSGVDLTTTTNQASASTACSAGSVCYVNATAGAVNGDLNKTASSSLVGTLTSRISSVDLVSSGGGCTMSSALTAGVNTVAIIKVTTDNTGANTLQNGDTVKTILNSIQVDYTKTNTVFVAATGMTIEKCGGSESAVTGDVASTTAAFNMSGMVNENKIVSQGTVYYAVKVNVQSVSSTAGDSSFEVDLNNLDSNDSSAANFKWQDSSDANNKFALLLTNSKITGTKITN
ncbi:MAG TPA: hypothetical protein VMD74_00700 [Candidatus Methylomirabilis sp.]|nr:hypothetical protein [Candidatus Methylomirabilis sp.]